MIFVTFEGIDGSGKSTQAQRLVERLSEDGRSAVLFREPGGTDLSERIRSLLLDPSLDIRDVPELLLFSSARAQLVEEAVRPALSKGTIVVCDRFYDSTTAYQGAGRGIADVGWMRDFHRFVTGDLTPDRTYLIALSPEEAWRRRNVRSSEADVDRMEQSDRPFYERVAESYDRLAADEPSRFVRLDGRRSIEDIAATIWSDIQSILDERKGTASSDRR